MDKHKAFLVTKTARPFDALAAGATGGTPRSFTISVAKNPNIDSWSLWVEGVQFLPPDFTLAHPIYSREFTDFEVIGGLDLKLEAKGRAGSLQMGRVAARLLINGEPVGRDLLAKTNTPNGYAEDHETYPI